MRNRGCTIHIMYMYLLFVRVKRKCIFQDVSVLGMFVANWRMEGKEEGEKSQKKILEDD